MKSDLIAEIRAVRSLPPPAIARAFRRACGVTQERMAAELGVSRATVTRWETGARRPRGRLARDYAKLIERLKVEAAS